LKIKESSVSDKVKEREREKERERVNSTVEPGT